MIFIQGNAHIEHLHRVKSDSQVERAGCNQVYH